ncbi:hypothetical protein ACFL13_00050 [Patescibacteria group bacterium]
MGRVVAPEDLNKVLWVLVICGLIEIIIFIPLEIAMMIVLLVVFVPYKLVVDGIVPKVKGLFF